MRFPFAMAAASLPGPAERELFAYYTSGARGYASPSMIDDFVARAIASAQRAKRRAH